MLEACGKVMDLLKAMPLLHKSILKPCFGGALVLLFILPGLFPTAISQIMPCFLTYPKLHFTLPGLFRTAISAPVFCTGNNASCKPYNYPNSFIFMGIFFKCGIYHTLKFSFSHPSCHFWLNLWLPLNISHGFGGAFFSPHHDYFHLRLFNQSWFGGTHSLLFTLARLFPTATSQSVPKPSLWHHMMDKGPRKIKLVKGSLPVLALNRLGVINLENHPPPVWSISSPMLGWMFVNKVFLSVNSSPGRRQAIIWTNAGILLIGPLGTNFSEIFIKIKIFSLTNFYLQVLSAKVAAILSWPQCVNQVDMLLRPPTVGDPMVSREEFVLLWYNIKHTLNTPVFWWCPEKLTSHLLCIIKTRGEVFISTSVGSM